LNKSIRNQIFGVTAAVFTILGIAGPTGLCADSIQIIGERTAWQPLTVAITGPESGEKSDPNPFLDYRVAVEFTRGNLIHRAPAYFAADGNAAETSATAGNNWRAHFVAPEAGEWSYRVSFRQGASIAIDPSPLAGSAMDPDGQTGSVVISEDPNARGMLRHVRKRYLQFAASGEYFLKSGADSPENLLAYVDFDGTKKANNSATKQGEATGGSLHQYRPHTADWTSGDPTWKGGRGKALIGAINYLASQGVNSMYFLTMNVRGDGNDVWPWISPDDRSRFDCSKLDQWEIVFSHMERRGISLHVVLTETENESLLEHEEGNDFAAARRLYYRELSARFGHHRGLVWNLGEENGWDDRESKDAADEHWRKANTTEQRKQFARYIREADPYQHPIVVHTLPGRYEEIYRPLLGDPFFDGLSLQVHLGPKIHEETAKWIEESKKAGWQWFANLDEIGPASDGVKPDADDPEHNDVRRFALWGNLMAGGSGCEWYFGYKFAHNDLNLEDFRSRETMWKQTNYAVRFFQDHLPFWDMQPANQLCAGNDVYCFAKPDEVYAVYVPGGNAGTIDLPEGEFTVQWYSPRDGGDLQLGSKQSVMGGPVTNVGDPPAEASRDWLVLLKRSE
jgi:hypothetical protein